MICSCGSSRISSGSLVITKASRPPFRSTPQRRAARGPRSGTRKSDRRARGDSACPFKRSGPGAILIHGLEAQETNRRRQATRRSFSRLRGVNGRDRETDLSDDLSSATRSTGTSCPRSRLSVDELVHAWHSEGEQTPLRGVNQPFLDQFVARHGQV